MRRGTLKELSRHKRRRVEETRVPMSGPDLQRELANRRQKTPIVFITASGDTTIRIQVPADGTVECGTRARSLPISIEKVLGQKSSSSPEAIPATSTSA